MLKFFRKNKEIIIPVLISLVFLGILLFFRELILPLFVYNKINDITSNIGIGLSGFILTAYTVFISLHNQISNKLKNTSILDKIERRFRLSLYLGISLLVLSILFAFFNNSFLPPIILGILFLLILLLIRLLGYLRLLFNNAIDSK